MVIHVYDAIPDGLDHSVDVLLRQCFHSSIRPDGWLREHEDRFCSQADVTRRVVAVGDEDVVGFATASRRTITWLGRTVILRGLGDVCTAPSHRRSGIATAMTRAVMHELHAAGCDVAYLCADVNDPGMVRLYGQAGFVPLGRPHTFLGRSGTRYTDADAMIAPVRSQAVFDAILQDSQPFDIGMGNW